MRGGLQIDKVASAKLLWLARLMEGIAETEEAMDPSTLEQRVGEPDPERVDTTTYCGISLSAWGGGRAGPVRRAAI